MQLLFTIYLNSAQWYKLLMGEVIRLHAPGEQHKVPDSDRKEAPIKPGTLEVLRDFRTELDGKVESVERGEAEINFLYDLFPNKTDYVIFTPDGKQHRVPISAFMQMVGEFQDSLGFAKERWEPGKLGKKTMVRTDIHDCSKKDGVELEERKIFDKGFNHLRTSVWIRRQNYRLIQGNRKDGVNNNGLRKRPNLTVVT